MVKTQPKLQKTARQSAKGASTHSLGYLDLLKSNLAHHLLVGRESLLGLLQQWPASLMTWMVIGIALALPAVLYILLSNVGNLGGDWQGKPVLSVYLSQQVNQQQGAELAGRLATEGNVTTARYISPEAALREFEQQSGLSNILNTLPVNPLPGVIEVEPGSQSAAEVRLLVMRIEGESGVSSVSVDIEWIERLFALLLLGERFVLALAVCLGLGMVLAIGNTIRLAILNRRAEIEVVKLVGGTDAFVRRPFLYLGFWYGMGGGLIAWLMVQAGLWFLSGPIEQLLHAYQNQFVLRGLNFSETCLLLGLGSGLGVLGAALAVGRHLYKIEPQ